MLKGRSPVPAQPTKLRWNPARKLFAHSLFRRLIREGGQSLCLPDQTDTGLQESPRALSFRSLNRALHQYQLH